MLQDIEKLHPLSPEVISRQATINVGEFCAQQHNWLGLFRLLHWITPRTSGGDAILNPISSVSISCSLLSVFV